MVIIKNKRTKKENILKEYPDAMIFDVTSKGEYKTLSPFYPHGGIPIPFSGTVTSACVEGIWQGLKVFENEGIDFSCFTNRTMKDLKRTVRTHGRCLGRLRNRDCSNARYMSEHTFFVGCHHILTNEDIKVISSAITQKLFAGGERRTE